MWSMGVDRSRLTPYSTHIATQLEPTMATVTKISPEVKSTVKKPRAVRKPRATKPDPVESVETQTPSKQVKQVKPKQPRRAPRPRTTSLVNAQTIRAFLAALAAGFLPAAAYFIAHGEVQDSPGMWVLVVASLIYSAPTLAAWVTEWTGSKIKAWGFTVLLEGVMIYSITPFLAPIGLMFLMGINCAAAWNMAVKVKKV